MLLTTKLFYRSYHYSLKLFSSIIPFPRPILYQGEHALNQLIENIKSNEQRSLLLVTDKVLKDLGLLEPLITLLKKNKIAHTIYSDVQPNPTIENVESGLRAYLNSDSQAIIALGGGSVMDCAKLIGARVAKPKKSVAQLKGLFKVLKKLPDLYAIPTTAGTGSETTIAAVVSDPINKQKYAVTDLVLMPKAAVLLPELTLKLPAQITAATGMDALTHAIEAYIGVNGNKFTNDRALKACKLIFDNLLNVYKEGGNLTQRNNMLLASFYAGEAFTRTSIGYVHAIAHNLGGLYGTPHGLANAVTLPYILKWYDNKAHKSLAEIARYCNLGNEFKLHCDKANALIETIENLNKQMGLPTGLPELRESDISMLATKALKEAHPDYPVPKFMTLMQCKQVISKLLV
ncbi:iron-containing alcohol dehydrogenase [Pseudoalteromonas sp. C2R02]|uniref:iron-containing alcohol dehydrogenase n=1 Tax=Pseudoalteromonas sp. C2R02 TaxID=2841565 RepID=UPI001C09A691|nr:iron-containing alcohol dehydrogenase [Pseudoalteromonas sp. C2R02]MBU2970557.1 iron-containing alcohol dehydrogenase [Pseudoalteromonas sp. C2R02]